MFAPAVAVPLVNLACERSKRLGRARSPWDGTALARPRIAAGSVERSSPILDHHPLQPWRHHRWLSPPTPRDAQCCTPGTAVVERYTRRLRAAAMVLGVDATTSIRTIHRSCAHARAPPGQHSRAWRPSHPRGVVHCTPVQGSWLQHVEPGFSLRQRKRRRIVDGAAPADLETTRLQCMAKGHAVAPPGHWTTTSVAKVMAAAVPAAA